MVQASSQGSDRAIAGHVTRAKIFFVDETFQQPQPVARFVFGCNPVIERRCIRRGEHPFEAFQGGRRSRMRTEAER
jgi:hypothetical protein